MSSLFYKSGCAGLFFSFVLSGLTANAEGQPPPVQAEANQVPQSVRDMQGIEDRWSDAVTKRDQYGLELVLAPQFIGISAAGDVTTRDQQIASLFIKGAGPLSLEQKVVSVRTTSNDNIAIVNGTYVMHWKLENGPMDEKGIFSHVFEHTRAGWICLNAQQTVVAETGKAAAGPTQKEKEKPKTSTASLPFHIPLLYKGPKSTEPAPAPGASSPQN